jgi:hypothetical protein
MIKISPSQFHKFFSEPHTWFRETVLGEKEFKGNTATVLGTLVHRIAELYVKGEKIDTDKLEKEIEFEYTDNPDVDFDEVFSNYKVMAETLINDYVRYKNYKDVEVNLSYKLSDKYPIYLEGTIDGVLETNTIVDYKTHSSKYPPTNISLAYRYQQLLYCHLCDLTGYNYTDRFELVYINKPLGGGLSPKTGKPLKAYPPKVSTLSAIYDEESKLFIGSVLQLCVESLEKVIEDPKLTYLIFKDYRFKHDEKIVTQLNKYGGRDARN